MISSKRGTAYFSVKFGMLHNLDEVVVGISRSGIIRPPGGPAFLLEKKQDEEEGKLPSSHSIWQTMLKDLGSWQMSHPRTFKARVRQGIPSANRANVWLALAGVPDYGKDLVRAKSVLEMTSLPIVVITIVASNLRNSIDRKGAISRYFGSPCSMRKEICIWDVSSCRCLPHRHDLRGRFIFRSRSVESRGKRV